MPNFPLILHPLILDTTTATAAAASPLGYLLRVVTLQQLPHLGPQLGLHVALDFIVAAIEPPDVEITNGADAVGFERRARDDFGVLVHDGLAGFGVRVVAELDDGCFFEGEDLALHVDVYCVQGGEEGVH